MFKSKKKTKILLSTTIACALMLCLNLKAEDDDDEDEGREQARSGRSEKSESGFWGERNIPVVQNAKWKTECGSCHMLYLPGLLPERSWNKMMNGLDNHFGENAALDEASKKEITTFLSQNSADHKVSKRGSKISGSIADGQEPLRISETPYFINKHHEVSADTYKRKAIGSAANCIACHSQAEKGNFSEEGVKIPKATELPKSKIIK